jgi:2-C-methyl-D-erythritol 4-phosphate cytidylyltransferase
LSTKTHHYWAIVPAAGSGSRMGIARPKQYLPLYDGKPILQHTLERLNLSRIMGIVVCVAENDPYWKTIELPRKVIQMKGGQERCHSVLNGLKALQQQADAQPEDWVLVHDAARPCVRPADIEKLMTQLADHPIGGLLAVPVRDTLKRAQATAQNTHPFWGEKGLEVIETINRESLWHALTPQMFRLQALTEALQNVLNRGELVTDDAQAMEKMGHQPVLIEGHVDNIKITHPQDLSLAELYLQEQNL